ncbi:nuclear transport factor 2 family protein [Kribbella sp. CA-253562]|uniref:nuclear transport factor 2 family protein n=1 Tax=Kribbella sp. CA-253562 TaxID=3239942 RepID=UPI003D8C4C9A
MNRIDEHVEAFNRAVGSGEWDAFAERLAVDATMTFDGVLVGPFHGRAAIAEGYRGNPPTATMHLIDSADDGPAATTARFAWASDATGTMRITWSRTGEVQTLTVSFD